MKNWKKILFVNAVLVFTVPCMIFAGGSQTGGNAGTVFSGAGAPKGYAVPVSQGGELTDKFSMFAPKVVLSPADTPMQRALREKTGISFSVRGIQSTDVQTSLNLMLASGEQLDDLIVMPRDSVLRNALIDSGKVLELSFLYNSSSLKIIPNIPKKIKDFVKESDGKFYVFPGYYDQNPDDPFPGWTLNALWMRTDLMQQVGVTEQDIATIEGFEAALRKLRALRNPAGQPMIPLSFRLEGHHEKLILGAFGVDMAGSVSGMPTVMEISGRRVFAFDNPNFLEAYKWINRLYTEGLIDMEVTTQTAERFQEKLESSQFAAYVGHQGQGMWDYWKGMNGPQDNPAKWYMTPFQSPRVAGRTKQAVEYVNPYPQFDIFVNRNTKHLNAVMNYLEYVQEPIYYRNHEAENGPEGTTWFFTDAERRLWRFTPEYERERSSGDAAREASTSPQIWQTGSSSKQWYPWFNQDAGDLAPGNFMLPKYCAKIGNEIVNHRSIKTMDMVQASPDSAIVMNLPTMNQVYDEYSAKMIMAKTTAECEAMYQEFLRMLESRARWSQMKAEWERLYAAMR